jgi:parvulin-like peptidyl-prolyl isomerase
VDNSDITPDAPSAARKPSASGGGGFLGGLIGLGELDPEVTDLLKRLTKDVDSLKVETDSLRHLHRVLRGLSKEQVERDLTSMRSEVRQVGRQLIEMCDNL